MKTSASKSMFPTITRFPADMSTSLPKRPKESQPGKFGPGMVVTSAHTPAEFFLKTLEAYSQLTDSLVSTVPVPTAASPGPEKPSLGAATQFPSGALANTWTLSAETTATPLRIATEAVHVSSAASPELQLLRANVLTYTQLPLL